MSAGWLVTLVTAAFLLGYGARALVAWWRQEEEREDEGFYRHFGAALTHLGASRTKEAIDELTQAARHRSDIAGLYLILGDLYRELGQFDRAIRIHASLLPRTDLSRTERAQAYTGLGEDYRAAGILDRSKEAFKQALDLDPRSLAALKGLSRFAVEGERWAEAADLEDRILRLEPTRSGHSLGYIYYEMGVEELKADDEKAALRAFQKAVAVHDRVFPAYLFLGDIHHKQGRVRKARESWEKIVDANPRLLHLVYDRLEQVYADEGETGRLESICHHVAERDPADWRVRLLLARSENHRGNPDAAYRHLMEAVKAHPCSMSVQRELWKMTAQRGLDPRITREMAALHKGPGPFVDPYVCSTCRFRSRTYLWRCPGCHAWASFTDETPARAPAAESPATGGKA